jgi:hypothetical protein
VAGVTLHSIFGSDLLGGKVVYVRELYKAFPTVETSTGYIPLYRNKKADADESAMNLQRMLIKSRRFILEIWQIHPKFIHRSSEIHRYLLMIPTQTEAGTTQALAKTHEAWGVHGQRGGSDRGNSRCTHTGKSEHRKRTMDIHHSPRAHIGALCVMPSRMSAADR